MDEARAESEVELYFFDKEALWALLSSMVEGDRWEFISQLFTSVGGIDHASTRSRDESSQTPRSSGHRNLQVLASEVVNSIDGFLENELFGPPDEELDSTSSSPNPNSRKKTNSFSYQNTISEQEDAGRHSEPSSPDVKISKFNSFSHSAFKKGLGTSQSKASSMCHDFAFTVSPLIFPLLLIHRTAPIIDFGEPS